MNLAQKAIAWTVFTNLEDVPIIGVDNDQDVLVLAPFSKTPKIDFGQLKLGATKPVERILAIQNIQTFDVNLKITCQDLELNNMQLTIPSMETVHICIRWKPDVSGSYSHAILFEVTNAARLKFIVHAFGVCVPAPKRTRKPLVQFQPKVSVEAVTKAASSLKLASK